MEPPMVIYTDERSIKFEIAEKSIPLSPLMIPYIIKPKHSTKPKMEAKSTYTHP